MLPQHMGSVNFAAYAQKQSITHNTTARSNHVAVTIKAMSTPLVHLNGCGDAFLTNYGGLGCAVWAVLSGLCLLYTKCYGHLHE